MASATKSIKKKNFRKIPKGREQWCCRGVLRREVDAGDSGSLGGGSMEGLRCRRAADVGAQ